MINRSHNPIAASAPLRRGCRVTREFRNRRHAVTLVELLITMAILSILAAAFLGAQNAALEASRRARTKTTIAKIHTLLMEKWSDYKTARVDLQFVTTPGLPPIPGQLRADMMLDALRMTQKLEMPDRWSDILGRFDQSGETVANALPDSTRVDDLLTATALTKIIEREDFNGNTYRAVLGYPDLTRVYLRRYSELKVDEEDLLSNQEAECLYLIIMNGTGDGEARSLFGQRDIGDTDDDGAPELLDGWGRPIRFVRWPAGFYPSDLMSINRNAMPPPFVTGDFDADHDPFDYFRRDSPLNGVSPAIVRPTQAVTPGAADASFLSDNNGAYRLLPLVFSAGPDGDSDLFTGRDALIGLDPYRQDVSSNGMVAPLGTPMDDSVDPSLDGNNSLDNIHNHQID